MIGSESRLRWLPLAMCSVLLLVTLHAFSAQAAPVLRVAYAGSMGVVMDTQLGPAFCRRMHCRFEGIGRGAWGLARLLGSHMLRADIFISATYGPMQLLSHRRQVLEAIPVARTAMVLAYNPRGRLARLFSRARVRGLPWWRLLERRRLRLGRTDPRTDPQGRNVIFTLLLAERFYHQPGLAKRILGCWENPAQIFSESSLMSRLESGQLDAAITYMSAAVSYHLPYLNLPDRINLGVPTLGSQYRSVAFRLHQGAPLWRPHPLVFYAGILVHSGARAHLARAFVRYLNSKDAASIWHRFGYMPMHVLLSSKH